MLISAPEQALPARWDDIQARKMSISANDLDLRRTLDCGQAFRWRESHGKWLGVIGDQVFRIQRVSSSDIEYRAWPSLDSEGLLSGYFRLEVDLADLRRLEDPVLTPALKALPGLRVLGQLPIETLLTFACSPVNNVTRITRSIDALSRIFGRLICSIDGVSFAAFPSAASLAEIDDADARGRANLGFRARTLRCAAVYVRDQGHAGVERLRAAPFTVARELLTAIPGIGPKIADCVCLFGLGHDQAVPIDTHVFAIGRETLGFAGPAALTRTGYERMAQQFRDRFGPWAGWAQQYLYHARRLDRRLPSPSEVRSKHARIA